MFRIAFPLVCEWCPVRKIRNDLAQLVQPTEILSLSKRDGSKAFENDFNIHFTIRFDLKIENQIIIKLSYI